MAPLPQQRIKRELVKDSNSDMDSNDQSNNNGVSDDEPRKKRLRPSTRQKQNRNQNKKRKISSGSSFDEESSGSEEEKFSRRRRVNPKRQAAKVCYRDDSDDSDLLEDKSDADEDELEPKKSGSVFSKSQKEFQIDKIIAQRRGKIGAVGPATTIYAIEENGDPNGDCDPNDLQSTEVQFLIKWKGSAYIHSTWESEKSLKETFKSDFHCTKKLRDFSNNEEEIAHLKKRATREDAEYFAYEHELQQSLVDSYYVVERIIAMSNDDDDQKSCLVKWQSLPYAEATWEDVALIERKWSDRIREYDEREKSDKFPSKTCSALNNRPKFKQLTSQPEYIAGGNPNANLRDYQLHGLNWLIYAWCSKNSVILADEMGLGKTIQIISFLHFLYHEHQVYGPFLVVVPLSTMTAWQREFELWAPGMNVVTYIGDKTSRKLIRDYEWCFANTHRPKFNVILTTYETALCDKAILGSLRWAVLMVDEAHRLKNDESLLHKVLYEFHTYHRLLITGTPLQNDLKELWALLHFIMPSKFPSWEEFEEDHQDAVNQGFTTLHEQLEPFILRRVKKDVEKSLPAKVEQILRIEMTSAQKKFYRWILTKNFKALQKESKGSAKSFLNVIMQLRKCCNHSFLIEQPDSEESHEMSAEEKLKQLIRGSGKLLLLDKLLTRLRETGHRVLIFSQMVIMLDILAEYLEVRRFPFQRLDGGIRGDVRRLALDHFNAENSQDFCFLLSTRAGGLGINLATADTVIIFDSDYNPQNDLQAQARAHRIGQTKQVNIYRLVTANSVEEQIVERAKKKMILDHLIIQRMDTTGRTVLNDYKSVEKASIPFNKDELSAILKFGAANLFKKDAMGDEEPVCDIDEILRRAEIREEEAPTTMGDELLSAFKMANFVATGEEDEPPRPNEQENDPNEDWDEIIPKNFRARLEEEERAKEMADSYLPPKRIRKTIHNNINDNDDDESDDDEKEQLNVSKVSNYSEESNASSDDDESDDDDDDDDDEDIVGSQARVKTAAPNTNSKLPYEGFTITEIQKILASLKKFPAPMTRLTEVARAANVRYKTTIELNKLAAYIYDRCHELMRTYKNYVQTVMSSAKSAPDDAVPSVAPPMSFTIKNVTVNARKLLAAEEFLKPLNEVMPANVEERSSWTLKAKVKPGGYANVDWTIEDDSKLLRGIYQHGMGNWKAMKSDPSLGLEHKILRADDKELDSKGLKKRTLYLLRILRSQISRNGAKKSVENGSGPEKKAGGSDAKHNSKEKMNRSGPEKKTDDSDTEYNSEEEMNGYVPEGKTDDSDVECNSKVEKEMNGSGPEGQTDDSEESRSDNDSWKCRCSI